MIIGIRRAAWGSQGGLIDAAQSIDIMISYRDHQTDSGGRIVDISINKSVGLGLGLA